MLSWEICFGSVHFPYLTTGLFLGSVHFPYLNTGARMLLRYRMKAVDWRLHARLHDEGRVILLVWFISLI